jgi:hypothetical protein
MAVGFPAKTTYVDGDVFSASDINDTNGTINLLTSSTLSIAAGKNALINGGFDIWQRGTTSTSVGYIADRWYFTATGSSTQSQETTNVPTGYRYAYTLVSNGGAVNLYTTHYIEPANAIRYANQTVTISALIAASASTGVSISIYYNTAIDAGPASGGWTAITPTSGGSGTATNNYSTYTQISGVYTIPSTAKGIAVQINSTSATSNAIYLTGLQLELGSTATTFSRAGGTIQGELAACQRYYEKSYSQTTFPGAVTYEASIFSSGTVAAPTTGFISYGLRFIVTKRAIPTMTFYDAAGNVNKSGRTTIGVNDNANQAITSDQMGQMGGRVYSSGTTNNASFYFHYIAEAEL